MTTKHTLISLCTIYDKVEIPIIQRDYAQGREEQGKLRNKFVEFLINSLENNKHIELDFVYGNIRKDKRPDNTDVTTFIPIDGQQRLTTLWLLHWLLSVKEGRLVEMCGILSKFVYETRPTAHSFCNHLMTEDFPKNIDNITDYIKIQSWFDNEWMKDGTVQGMIRMLDTLEKHSSLSNGTIKLDQLKNPKTEISFFFVPLEQFGLSEDLYIRMNARGKVLTDFENFKSEFYKIIQSYSHIDVVKDKMEYEWINNLWPYRKKNTYVTDECFMHYLQFISKMLFFKQAKSRNDVGYPNEFLDLDLLNSIYTQQDNVDFLIFALDILPQFSSLSENNLLWDKGNSSLPGILSSAIKGENLTTDKQIILYSALMFMKKHKDYSQYICDLVRVIRNLIFNTPDKSEREWPRIIKSIDDITEECNVYEFASKDNFNLEGLRDSQCHEEHFKALLFHRYPSSKEHIQIIEDDPHFSGNVRNIIAGIYKTDENEIQGFEFKDTLVETFQIEKLKSLYEYYNIIADNDFNQIWGDLIDSSLYRHEKSTGRVCYDSEYEKNPAIIAFAVKFMYTNEKDLQSFITQYEKEKIKELNKRYIDFNTINDVKVQLFLLYILSCRIMKQSYTHFFKNGYNFGWLAKETGYTSLYSCGISGDPWFEKINPIFQTYKTQFRYNLGLYKEHALPPEIVGNGRPQNAWDKLINWAENNE